MPDVAIVIEVRCGNCGEWLTSTGEQVRDGIEATVEPCPKCLEQSYDTGVSDGAET